MRVLVTGGAGFIGTNLVLRLRELGHSVLIVDCLDETLYGEDVKRKNLARIFGGPVTADFHVVDDLGWVDEDVCNLSSAQSSAAIWARKGVDTVFHLAGLAGVRPSLVDPLRYSRTNVEGTVAVLEFAKNHDADVVFASSSSIYGTLRSPFKESDRPTAMISPYAVTKRQCELLMDYYAQSTDRIRASLRFFTVYGPHGRPDMFIRDTIGKVERGETITLYGDGSSFRDYTYVDDIVDGILAAAGTPRKGHHIYNLGFGTPNTLSYTVELIGELVGKKPIIEHIGDQEGDVPGTLADIARAQFYFGYAPKFHLLRGLTRTVEWMKENR